MTYIFDKSSKKFVCPSCNKKRFVRFVNIETNNYLEEIYGRCDRESSCGYFVKPNTDKSAIVATKTNTSQHYKTTDFTKNNENNKPLQRFLQSLLDKTLQKFCNNNLYLYLITLFDKKDVDSVFQKYKIGTSKNWNGATVFWQTDNHNNIKTGKIMLFDKLNCKRVKEPYNHITWIHKKVILENFVLQQCLFGLHLINSSKKIGLVESEKTCVIMALFLPEYTWLATGNKQNFKNEMLQPIKNLNIIAFPDKSEFEDWSIRATELNKIGYSIKVSDFIEKQNFEVGTDLADVYISLNSNKPSFEELSKDEMEVVRLSKGNSNLLQLITAFDLCDSFDNQFKIEKLKQFI